MISKSNQHINDRKLDTKKGVRFNSKDYEKYGALALELGLNDRRGAEGFAEFARLAVHYTYLKIEQIRAKGGKAWKDAALAELGVDPDDIFED
jgi:hypothetical protein